MIDGAAFAASYLHIYFGQLPAAVRHARSLGARDGDFELLTLVLATLGEAISAGRLTDKLADWNSFARSLGQFHQRFDLFLTPTLAHPPVVHGSGDPPPGQQAALGFLQRTGLLGVMARLGLLDVDHRPDRPRQPALRALHPAGQPDRHARHERAAVLDARWPAAGRAVHRAVGA